MNTTLLNACLDRTREIAKGPLMLRLEETRRAHPQGCYPPVSDFSERFREAMEPDTTNRVPPHPLLDILRSLYRALSKQAVDTHYEKLSIWNDEVAGAFLDELTEAQSLLNACRFSHVSIPQQIRINVRQITWNDYPEAIAVCRAAYGHPYSGKDFLQALKKKHTVGYSAEIIDGPFDGCIVGSMLCEFHKNRLHVRSLGVLLEFIRHGIGAAMVNRLKQKMSEQRRHRILLRVHERDLPVQLFLRAQEFRAISVLRDLYDDTHEDAYLMQYRPPLSAEAENDPAEIGTTLALGDNAAPQDIHCSAEIFN